MIRKFLASFRSTATDRKGVTAAEYAILAVGVVIIVGSAVALFAPQLKNAFSNIGTQISTQQSAVAASAAR
jgi:pilus assembly protein Flp/PilA